MIRAAVVAITPDQLDGGKGLFQRLNHCTRSFLIGALGTQHFDSQEMALRVNEQVSFAPPNFFSPRRSPFQDRELHSF